MSATVSLPCEVRSVTMAGVEVRVGRKIHRLPAGLVASMSAAGDAVTIPSWLADSLTAQAVPPEDPAVPAPRPAGAAETPRRAPRFFSEPRERLDDDDMAAWRAQVAATRGEQEP